MASVASPSPATLSHAVDAHAAAASAAAKASAVADDIDMGAAQDELDMSVLNRDPSQAVAALKAGADPNKANAHGLTPLAMAANTGPTKLVHVLLQNGADASTVDKDGWSPLMYAASSGLRDIVMTLHEADSTAINAQTVKDGWTPLIRAAYRGHADTVSTLCELGADTSAVTKDGFTARDMAEQAKRHDCVVAIDDISPGGKRQRRRF